MPNPKAALEKVLGAYLVYTDKTGREIRGISEQAQREQEQQEQERAPVVSIPLGPPR